MGISKRLQRDIRSLSLRDLKALNVWLEQLIRHQERDQADEQLPGRRSISARLYTYRDEYVKCGKPGCKCAHGRGHGPYRYAYYKKDGRLRKKYVGTRRGGR